MHITLKTPELERFVEDQVSEGRYMSAEDVVNGALVLLRGQVQASPTELEELKVAIAAGLEEADRGLSEPWDVDEIASEVEQRFNNERKSG